MTLTEGHFESKTEIAGRNKKEVVVGRGYF